MFNKIKVLVLKFKLYQIVRIEKQIYYHIQTLNELNKSWNDGDLILFNKSKNCHQYSSVKKSFKDELRNIKKESPVFSMDLTKLLKLVEKIDFAQLDKDNQKCSELQKMINNLSNQKGQFVESIFRKFLLIQQDIVFEYVRTSYYNELPSRQNSIWVCENTEQIKKWIDTKNLVMPIKLRYAKILKVELTGIIHKTDGVYVNYKQNIELNKCLKNAHDYWIGVIKSENETECLFEGEVKILENIPFHLL